MRLVFLFACILALAACSTTSLKKDDPKAGLANGPLSGELAAGFDKDTFSQALDAEFTALEKGMPGLGQKWLSSSGARGEVTPGQRYQVGNATCRRYTHSVELDGIVKNAVATACKEEGGNWQILD